MFLRNTGKSYSPSKRVRTYLTRTQVQLSDKKLKNGLHNHADTLQQKIESM